MLEKLSQAAEQLATRVSRRQFLGRFGQGALVLAGVVGEFLAFPGESAAARGGCPYPTCLCRDSRRRICRFQCCGR